MTRGSLSVSVEGVSEWLITSRSILQQGENTMKPMLDPKRDLAGATPETLARALFRRTGTLRPGTRRKAVVHDEITEKKPATDKTGNGVSHLSERP